MYFIAIAIAIAAALAAVASRQSRQSYRDHDAAVIYSDAASAASDRARSMRAAAEYLMLAPRNPNLAREVEARANLY